MKLIIDIDEERFNIIKSNLYNTLPAEMKEWGLEAIRNGTPYETVNPQKPIRPCDVCRYNPPSSRGGKPCIMCLAEGRK